MEFVEGKIGDQYVVAAKCGIGKVFAAICAEMCIRDSLGIKGGDVSSEMVAYGFPQGVYVSSVSAGSGAANAGLQEGDIITAVDSTKIAAMTELQSALKSDKAGDKVTLTVARQSGRQYEESKVEVTLSSAKDIQQ